MTAETIQLQFPIGGLSDYSGFSDQAPLTTRQGQNVRAIDDQTGQVRGGQRSGSRRYVATTPNGSNKIKHLTSVLVANKKTLYTHLASGSEQTIFSTPTPNTTDAKYLAVDSQSNLYFQDGPTGIAKFNSASKLMFKLSVPVTDKAHVVRALHVDTFLGIYAGVSQGGVQKTAGLWKFKQGDKNTTSVQWTIVSGGYTVAIKRRDSFLYTLQNFPDRGQAFLICYQQIDSSSPTEAWRTSVPFPCNHLAVGPKDGALFVSSEPNATRGVNPMSPHTSAQQVDFVPTDIANATARIWSWYDASDPDTLVILPQGGGSSLDGGEVQVWIDKSGNGRNFLKDASAALTSGPVLQFGPTYRVNGIGGLPSLRFGANQSMFTVPCSSTDRADRASNLSALPMYKGAQFACFMVVRAPIDLTARVLLSIQANGASTGRAINLNMPPGGNITVKSEGSISLNEPNGVAGDAGATTLDPFAPAGAGGNPLGAASGPYGHTLITWICDGGIHDVFGTATRSQLRINGHPCERWQSDKNFASVEQVNLGFSNFQDVAHTVLGFGGEIAEMIVLSDYDDVNGNLQRLVSTGKAPTSPVNVEPFLGEAPTMPDSNSIGFDTGHENGEVQQIEGYLAHKWGLAHLFPGGLGNLFTPGGQPLNNETVTIDTVVYRFRTAGTLAAANDVTIGSAVSITFNNLYSAMTHLGIPGVDYHAATVPHPTYFSIPVFALDAVVNFGFRIQSRSPYAAPAACATTMTAAGSIWISANTTQRINGNTIAGGARGPGGFYPHPYFIAKMTTTAGGPPHATLIPGGSIRYDLNSVYGILAKFDPANGKLRWVLTSNYQNAGFGVGGIGYAAAVNSAGEVCTMGPRQATVLTPPIIADAFDIRKVVDSGDMFSLAIGVGINTAWTAAPGAIVYRYPQPDVDSFDNFYMPINTGANTETARVYQRAPDAGGLGNGVLIHTVNSLPGDPQAYAVAVDPAIPEYETDLSSTSNPVTAVAEFIYLGTAQTGNTNSVFRVALVSSTPQSGSPRRMVNLVVSGTNLKKFTTGGYVSVGTPFDVNSDYIDSTIIFAKVYYTDGSNYFVYDPKKDTLSPLRATSAGQIPTRCKLMAQFDGRLVLSRQASDPHNWFMSAHGDPNNFDFDPPVTTSEQAVSGNDPRVGPVPDIVNTLMNYNDERFLFGCENSIYEMLGDPGSDNCRIVLVTSVTGMAFGPSWAVDESGTIYFIGARGGLYAWPRIGVPTVISESTIPRRLREIDFGNYFVKLVWDERERGLRIYQCPFGAGGASVPAFFWERQADRMAPWQDKYGTSADTTIQPTYATAIHGDTSDQRLVLFGTENGRIMQYVEGATNDDTTPIDSFVMLGPLAPKEVEAESIFTNLKVFLAANQQGANYEFFVSDMPDKLGDVRYRGRLEPGQNYNVLVRARGGHVWLQLHNAAPNEGWSYEKGFVTAQAVGPLRVRR